MIALTPLPATRYAGTRTLEPGEAGRDPKLV